MSAAPRLLLLAALVAAGWVSTGVAAPNPSASASRAAKPDAAAPGALSDGIPTQQEAMALLQAGKREEALQAFERIIASHPKDPAVALFEASTIALDLNRWQEAKPYVDHLVRLRPGSMQAWELVVQVDQASGDRLGRRDATDRMYSAWRSALDPATQQRAAFTRDRIFGPTHGVLVEQTLEPSGDEVVRWVFLPIDRPQHPRHYLVVRSDPDTNERWREAGTVSYATVVYHLDAVRVLPGGQVRSVPYEFYLNEPAYDRVRKKVAAILSGEAKPLSGEADPFWTGNPVQP